MVLLHEPPHGIHVCVDRPWLLVHGLKMLPEVGDEITQLPTTTACTGVP